MLGTYRHFSAWIIVQFFHFRPSRSSPSVCFAIVAAQQPFLSIQMEEPAAVPAQASFDGGPIPQDGDKRDDGDNEQANRKVRVIGPKVADLEENVLKRANGRFGCELRWARHNSSQCLEDRRP